MNEQDSVMLSRCLDEMRNRKEKFDRLYRIGMRTKSSRIKYKIFKRLYEMTYGEKYRRSHG